MSRKDAGWMRHIDNIAEGIATRLDSLTGNVISITVIEQTIDAARRLKVPKEHIKKWANNRCGDIERVKFLIQEFPRSDRLILEAGTPLIKRYGVEVIGELRSIAKDVFMVADLKTMDVGKPEVDMAFDETADAVCCAGAASSATINDFIYETRRLGIYSFIDLMQVDDPNNPTVMENLVNALGADPVRHKNWYLCCGKACQRDEVPAEMMRDLLGTVNDEHADILCLICPTCFGQFDQGQFKVAKQFGEDFHTPTLYYFQLLAFAQGLAYEQLGVERQRFKPECLRRYEGGAQELVDACAK